MAGITLTQAQTNLDLWINISTQLDADQTVRHGDRTLTRHDLNEIMSMIDYWSRKCQVLSRGGSGISVQRLIVND